jgi:hypothetical protein
MMCSSRKVLSIVVMALAFGQVHAQDQEEKPEAEVRNAEAELLLTVEENEEQRREVEMQMQRAAAEMSRAAGEHEQARAGAGRTVEIEVRMREAEQALAAAAQQMADLSMRQLPRIAHIERIVLANRGPVLGVTIGDDGNGEPVDGVSIIGVSPGGAAAEAGLHAGDVITSINNESLAADSSAKANEKLLDFMQGVEQGDELEIEYLRNGKAQKLSLQPRAMQPGAFSFNFDSENFTVPDVPFPSQPGGANRFVWITQSGGFGDMELVKLTDELGSYFGTTEGLLVVRAPEDESLKLKDGDVILNIDGREPSSASHAMRILGSYESGETFTIEIMRNKRKQKVSVEVPDNTRSWLPHEPPQAPAVRVVPGVRPVAPPEAI